MHGASAGHGLFGSGHCVVMAGLTLAFQASGTKPNAEINAFPSATPQTSVGLPPFNCRLSDDRILLVQAVTPIYRCDPYHSEVTIHNCEPQTLSNIDSWSFQVMKDSVQGADTQAYALLEMLLKRGRR